jgi:tRNA(Leu) C34 or U34 (ribose-2'-O)-methylase TrmL
MTSRQTAAVALLRGENPSTTASLIRAAVPISDLVDETIISSDLWGVFIDSISRDECENLVRELTIRWSIRVCELIVKSGALPPDFDADQLDYSQILFFAEHLHSIETVLTIGTATWTKWTEKERLGIALVLVPRLEDSNRVKKWLLDSFSPIDLLIEVNVLFYSQLGEALIVPLSAIAAAIASPHDKSARRNGRWLLQTHVSRGNCSRCTWSVYFQILEAVEDYSSHLFKSVFGNVVGMVVCGGNGSESCLTPEWIFALLTRCLTHENVHVINHTVGEIFTRRAVDQTFPVCEFLFRNSIITATNLTQFLSLIESSSASFYQSDENAKNLIDALVLAVEDGEANSTLLNWALAGSKVYFPIVFCYLSVLARSKRESVSITVLMDLVSPFLESRILHFAAAMRPTLVGLIRVIVDRSIERESWTDARSICSLALAVHLGLVDRDLSHMVPVVTKMVKSEILNESNPSIVPFGVMSGLAKILRDSSHDDMQSILYSLADRPYMSRPVLRRIVWMGALCGLEIDGRIWDIERDFFNCEKLEELPLFLAARSIVDDRVILRAWTIVQDAIMGGKDNTLLVTIALILLCLSKPTTGFPSLSLSDLMGFTPSRQMDSVDLPGVLPELANESSFTQLDTRDKVWSNFQKFKWKLVETLSRSPSTELGIRESMLSELSVLGSGNIATFNNVARNLGLDRDNEFLGEYIDVAWDFVSNRKSEGISTQHISDLIRFVFASPGVEGESFALLTNRRIKFMHQLLIVGETCNPTIGRIGVMTFVTTLGTLLTSTTGKPLITLLSDLICFKEGFDERETCSSDQVKDITDQMRDGLVPLETSVELTSAYSRVLVLVTLRTWCERNEENAKSILAELVMELIERIKSFQAEYLRKKSPLTPLPFTPFHRVQLRVAQAISFLAPVLPLKTDDAFKAAFLDSLFSNLLSWPNQPDVRDYLESLAVYVITQLDDSAVTSYLLPVLRDIQNVPSQSVASFVLVGAYLVNRSSLTDNSLFYALLPFMSSNIAYLRGISQQWLFEMHSSGGLARLRMDTDPIVIGFVNYVSLNKEAVAMRKRLTLVYDSWDPVGVIRDGTILSVSSSKAMFQHGEFLPTRIFCNTVKEAVHESLSDNWFYTRDMDSLVQPESINGSNHPLGQLSTNSQRKYDPNIGCVFPDFARDQESLRRRRRMAATDLILVASFLEKNTNIAGLCRSAEVFGAKTIVVPTSKVLLDPTFLSMSVTAEKWIDFVEVTKENIPEYIRRLQRDFGYSAVCLEQTRDSVEISAFKFPRKTVLILGNEKTGMVPELLPLMDHCVEIPQLGVIRSLNVHVSGAIAMWQYMKSVS